jgi:hypothetical protein
LYNSRVSAMRDIAYCPSPAVTTNEMKEIIAIKISLNRIVIYHYLPDNSHWLAEPGLTILQAQYTIKTERSVWVTQIFPMKKNISAMRGYQTL